MNTSRAVSRSTTLLGNSMRRQTQAHLTPSLRCQLRNASTTTHLAARASPLMKPVFWTVSAGVIGGIGYGLTRSTGRIGDRFEAREKRLDRQKWLKEGMEIDDKWLR